VKKVYQSKVSNVHGDCARAVVASLFELRLREVPKFFPDDQQAYKLLKYFQSRGYNPSVFGRKLPGDKGPTLKEVAKFDGGVNGYFYGSVSSQTYDCMHAVVLDKNLNVVHDPNPNGMCLGMGGDYVIDIWTMDDWIIDLNGNFVND